MGIFLNSKAPFEAFRAVATDSYFVDKSMLLGELIPSIGKEKRFFCITRPRRFGKSVMANMVAAFFSRAVEAKDIFQHLKISENQRYREHLNRHNVVFIDFSRVPEACDSYEAYIRRISDGLKEDLMTEYPELNLDKEQAVWDIFQIVFERTNHKFVFVIDEWDALFHMPFLLDNAKRKYLLFLKNLLKDQAYVELAYMTGILPIAKYSSGSELNLFLEYDMVTKKRFSIYFGFLENEVDQLFQEYRERTSEPEITREDLRRWYDGYYIAEGKQIYNPRSVVCALSENQLANYWTSSGPYDEIYYYIRNNIDDVREDLALMTAGEHIGIKLQGYGATETEMTTKNQIYSAMVIYGLLTYGDGEVSIPNKELMDKFDELLLLNEDLGYIHRLAKESEKMLKATLAGNTERMEQILKYVHDTESPVFSYNSEIELSAVVNLAYLAARDKYRVEREDKAGKGYVDFIFYPYRKGDPGIILELKVDCTPEEAIQQIKEKNYMLRFKGKLGESPKYTEKILAVGIACRKKTKEHCCKVEEIG